MKLAQTQSQFTQFIDLSPDLKKPDAIELKIEALRKQKEVERMRQTTIDMMNKERSSEGKTDPRSWNLLIGKRNNSKYTYDYDGKPLRINAPVVSTSSNLIPQAKVLSQNVIISQIVSEQPKPTQKSAPYFEPPQQRATTSIPKKSTPLEPIVEKKFLPSIKSNSASALEQANTPQLPQIPFESLEKQILRDLKPAKGVSLKVANGNIKESNFLDIIEETAEIAQERMSRDQYMKLRAEQESSIYNTLKSNYARMSKQQTVYTQAKVTNHINIVNNNSETPPITEIELEKNNIDDNYVFESTSPISKKKPATAGPNIFIEPRDFKKKQMISGDVQPSMQREKSRNDTETSITFCNDPKLINYFFEKEEQNNRNLSQNYQSHLMSPRNFGISPMSGVLKERGIDLLERKPQQDYFNHQFNKENNQRASVKTAAVEEKRSGSVVRFAEQTINFESSLIGGDKTKPKLPKSISTGTRTRDRFKTQVPRLKKLYDYFG